MSGAGEPRVLRADNPSAMTLDGTRTFLVGRERPVVIDPGPADPRHLRAVLDALGGQRPVAILLTHAHPDHAAGAPWLAGATGAPVRMAPGALDPGALAGAVERWIGEGDGVETDAGTLRALATPGHAPEHLAFVWTGAGAPAGGAVFVGDLLMGEGDTTLVAPPEGDLTDYLDSLQRLERLRAGVLYPAHGPPLRDAAAALRRYRAHREARIDQVREARRRHPGATPGALLEAVYGDALPPELRAAAKGSIRAILDYLDRAPD